MAQQLINAIVFGSVLTLFSVGLSLSWGTLDVLNLAHGALFVFAAYIAFELTTGSELPFALVVLVGMAGAGLAAMAMELVAFGRVRSRFPRREAELSMLVASVGAAILLNKIVSEGTGYTVFTFPDEAFDVKNVELAGVQATNIEVVIVAATIVLVVALDRWIMRSRTGRAVRSLAYDPSVAELMGINVRLLGAITMFVSGALAGLAGVLVAVSTSGMEPHVGETFLLTAFAIQIVGGVGNLRGAVVAAYLIALAQTLVVAYGPSTYRDGIAFLVILVVLLVRPQGLFARGRFERA